MLWCWQLYFLLLLKATQSIIGTNTKLKTNRTSKNLCHSIAPKTKKTQPKNRNQRNVNVKREKENVRFSREAKRKVGVKERKILVKEVDEDQDPDVELRNELGVGFEEIVLGNLDDLSVGQYTHDLTARHPRINVLRHSSNPSSIPPRFRSPTKISRVFTISKFEGHCEEREREMQSKNAKGGKTKSDNY